MCAMRIPEGCVLFDGISLHNVGAGSLLAKASINRGIASLNKFLEMHTDASVNSLNGLCHGISLGSRMDSGPGI